MPFRHSFKRVNEERRSTIDTYIQRCFDSETPLRASELAQMLNLAPHAFTRWFKSLYGVPPAAYLKTAQIARALYLLETTALSTSAVGYASGFGTRRSFFRAFKRAAGVTPDRYRGRFKRSRKTDRPVRSPHRTVQE